MGLGTPRPAGGDSGTTGLRRDAGRLCDRAAHPGADGERLVRENVLTRDDLDRRTAEFRDLLSDAQAYARDFMPRQQVFAFGGAWKGLGYAGDDWRARTSA